MTTDRGDLGRYKMTVKFELTRESRVFIVWGFGKKNALMELEAKLSHPFWRKEAASYTVESVERLSIDIPDF